VSDNPGSDRPLGQADGPPSAAARRLAAARQRVTDTRERLEAARPRSKLVDAVFGVAEHDVVTGGGLIAGALAFRIFMFMVPYVFCIVAALGLAAGSSDRSASDVASDFGVAGLVATGVKGMADVSLPTRVAALAVGLVALLFAARALVKTLRVAYGLIWGISRSKAHSMTREALGLIVVVTGGLVLGRLIVELGSVLGRIILLGVFVAVPTGIWLFVTGRALPHPEGATWRDLLPGAIVVGVGVEVLHIATVVWFSRSIENKSETYGVLGAALAILLWAYVLGRFLALSATVNAARWYQTHPPRGIATRRRASVAPAAPADPRNLSKEDGNHPHGMM
jgi:uncharacterized BrkB/YihY/UPF0761 family membrane protein